MKVRFVPVLAALAVAAPLAAQQHQHGAQGGDHMAAMVRPHHEGVKGYVIRSAEQMPEENYAFKPTPEVRSFGQLIGHIANANYMICSMASGEANPSRANLEQTTAKAALVQALKESFAFCDRAYQTSDAKLMEKVDIFGQQQDRLYALIMNVGHVNEHYGNLVTYLRLKGLVPPSSQR
jgi:uncharacterized damage-inducible protein DinB